MQRDDFENRLGQGLKRWAQAGEPTLDLEALVKQRAAGGQLPAEPETEEPHPLSEPRQPLVEAPEPPIEITRVTPRRRWSRWLSGVAAAAALLLAIGFTFPTWAGAAAGWPLVGPVVKEIIMKDAGLKWAYDQGFIQETVAEVTEDGVTVRILGFVADRARTTLIYQITGWEDPPRSSDEKPRPAEGGSKWLNVSRPVSQPPSIFITQVNRQGGASWMGQAVRTPVGMLGTASTQAIDGDQATVEVMVMIGGKKIPLRFDVKRTAEASREVSVNLAQEIGGVNVKVNSVVYTPAETLVRYEAQQGEFYGAVQLQAVGGLPYLEVNGEKVQTNSSVGFGGQTYIIFPKTVKGNARFVVPGLYKAAEIDVRYPLERGTVQQVAGTPVSLTDFLLSAGRIDLEWEWPEQYDLMGISSIELISAAGEVVKLRSDGESLWRTDGKEGRRVGGTIPDGFQLATIRIGKAAVAVKGPWIFDLPK